MMATNSKLTSAVISMLTSTGTNWRKEARVLLRLAGPLVVNNLAVAGMNFADAIMAGRLGVSALAAVAVGGAGGRR